jgi:hypothetical protein
VGEGDASAVGADPFVAPAGQSDQGRKRSRPFSVRCTRGGSADRAAGRGGSSSPSSTSSRRRAAVTA